MQGDGKQCAEDVGDAAWQQAGVIWGWAGRCSHREELDATAPVDVAEGMISSDTEEEEEEQKHAIDEMFHQSDLRCKLKPDLLKQCVEQGTSHHHLEDGNGKKEGAGDGWMMVHKFFLEWHKRDDETMHNSLCFQAEVQTINRKHKKTTTEQRKDKIEENGRKAGKLKQAMGTVKKSVLSTTQVLVLFPGNGFFIAQAQIRCPCTCKVICRSHSDRRS